MLATSSRQASGQGGSLLLLLEPMRPSALLLLLLRHEHDEQKDVEREHNSGFHHQRLDRRQGADDVDVAGEGEGREVEGGHCSGWLC